MDPPECNPAQIQANEVQIVLGIDIFALSYGPKEFLNIKPLLLPDAL